MNESEQILKAIEDLGTRFDKSLASLRQDLAQTKIKQYKQSNKIQTIDKRQEEQGEQISEIRRILNELINSDALIKRTGSRAVLRKESVYDRFEKIGFDRYETLRALDRAGYIKRALDGKRTRPVRLPKTNECYRAIIINIKG